MFYSNPKSAYDKTWAASEAYFREQKILGKIDALKRYLLTLEERDKSLNGTDARLNSRIKAVSDEIAALEARIEPDEPRTAVHTPNQSTSKPAPTVQKVTPAIPEAHKTPAPRPLLTPKSAEPARRTLRRPHYGVAVACLLNNPSPHNPLPGYNPVFNNVLPDTTPKSSELESTHHFSTDQRRRHHLAPPPRSDKI